MTPCPQHYSINQLISWSGILVDLIPDSFGKSDCIKDQNTPETFWQISTYLKIDTVDLDQGLNTMDVKISTLSTDKTTWNVGGWFLKDTTYSQPLNLSPVLNDNLKAFNAKAKQNGYSNSANPMVKLRIYKASKDWFY